MRELASESIGDPYVTKIVDYFAKDIKSRFIRERGKLFDHICFYWFAAGCPLLSIPLPKQLPSELLVD